MSATEACLTTLCNLDVLWLIPGLQLLAIHYQAATDARRLITLRCESRSIQLALAFSNDGLIHPSLLQMCKKDDQ